MIVHQLIRKQNVDCLCQLPLLRLLQHLEPHNILNSQALQFEDKVANVHTQDLWRKTICHPIEPCFSIDPKTLTISDSASPSRTLIGTALATGHHDHLVNACLPIEHLHLYVPTVNHEADFRNGDGALCYIGG